MGWEKYAVDVEDYLRLVGRYDVRFEFEDGKVCLRDGTPVILLGGVVPEDQGGSRPETALVVISNATGEEVAQLAALVAALRGRPGDKVGGASQTRRAGTQTPADPAR